jgi:signal transduction histidine kinase
VNRALDDPLTVALHEIRAPLGLVSMAAQVAAELSDDEAVKHKCQSIVQVASRLLRVTSSIYALSASSSNVDDESYVPVAIVHHVCSDLVALNFPISLDVEQRCGLAEASGSSVLFEGLLQSLLMNAFDHGAPGEAIQLRVRRREGALVVSIGNRIAEHRSHRGTGLGNLIAEQLASALGCTIGRASTPDFYTVELLVPMSYRAVVPARTPRRALSRRRRGQPRVVPAFAAGGE